MNRTGNVTTLVRHDRVRPIGLIWNSRDYSCGYDATLTILANIWTGSAREWKALFALVGPVMGEFGYLMVAVTAKRISFERARDIVRRRMHDHAPDSFPYGANFTSIDRIATALMPSVPYAIAKQVCPLCGHRDRHSYGMLESYLSAGLSNRQDYRQGVPMQEWVNKYLTTGRTSCGECGRAGRRVRMIMNTVLRDAPPLMLIDINHHQLDFSGDLRFITEAGNITMKLRGIIYGGQNHFTCRVIDPDGTMWFHDGIGTRGACIPELNIQEVADPLALHKCGEKSVVAVVYAKQLM
ncbi:hypothetical protein C8R43DRAFT_868555 [Mycena crocata]|nr:hypothetical protein C8R43DRAFT_868555 [Mycena crocata]